MPDESAHSQGAGELVLATPLPADRRPDLVYLAKLGTPKSRRSQAGSIRAICQAMVPPGAAAPAPELVPWHRLRYQHTQAIRARLAGACAPATANRHLAALRGVLREAWRLGLMSADDLAVATDIGPVKGTRIPRGKALGRDQVAAMVRACDTSSAAGARDAAVVAVAYNGGLRREEIARLCLADLVGDELRVLGKGRRERTVHVPWAVPRIERWLGFRGRESGPLFCAIDRWGNHSGVPLSDQGIYVIVRAAAARAGVGDVSPHDMRRTCITTLLDVGVDLSTAQQVAGHASPTTTARYDRGGERRKQRAGELLAIQEAP
ncbi:MAG: site-specific integrase [Polyangiaceae bacterium]|nr:site-specific integrase [Polyangiaceae bacterium]